MSRPVPAPAPPPSWPAVARLAGRSSSRRRRPRTCPSRRTDAAPGGFGKLTFRVPTRATRPARSGCGSRCRRSRPWPPCRCCRSTAGRSPLTNRSCPSRPRRDGQEITSYVSVVEFRADGGGGIAPGEFQEFSLSGGPSPRRRPALLPDGADLQRRHRVGVDRADRRRAAGARAPRAGAHPDRWPRPGRRRQRRAADPADVDDDGAYGTAVTALVLSVLGLLAGLGGLALGLAARRRTVAP